jgi:hypothetical protein
MLCKDILRRTTFSSSFPNLRFAPFVHNTLSPDISKLYDYAKSDCFFTDEVHQRPPAQTITTVEPSGGTGSALMYSLPVSQASSSGETGISLGFLYFGGVPRAAGVVISRMTALAASISGVKRALGGQWDQRHDLFLLRSRECVHQKMEVAPDLFDLRRHPVCRMLSSSDPRYRGCA